MGNLARGHTRKGQGLLGSVQFDVSDHTPGCQSDRDIVNGKPGGSHILCNTYLVPKDAKELAVHRTPKEDSKPYVWKFKSP
jgi:hypothetical protein